MKIFIVVGLLSSLAMAELVKDMNISELRHAYSKPLKEWPKPELDEGVAFKEMVSLEVDRPKRDALINLGVRFFHEARFSTSMDISCASCHAPNKAFTEHTRTSRGHNGLKGERNSPTLYGVFENKQFFWDGRAATLEEQALGPISDPLEMAMPLDVLSQKLKTMSGYERDLEEVYGDSNLTLKRIAHAITAYEKTIIPPRTKFDEFLDGNVSALDERELLGLHLFRTKARCMNCHSGKYLSDGEFHNLGLTYYNREMYEDLGKYNISKDNKETGKFKTPTLRQIVNTAPYMHNGLFAKLGGIISMYNAGMPNIQAKTQEEKNDLKFPQKSEHLKKLNLTKEEQVALLFFLRTL